MMCADIASTAAPKTLVPCYGTMLRFHLELLSKSCSCYVSNANLNRQLHCACAADTDSLASLILTEYDVLSYHLLAYMHDQSS